MTAPRLRRWVLGGAVVVVPLLVVVAGGHRGAHVARSLLVPGGGLLDERPVVGALLVVLAIVATVAWVRWGVDWAVLAVVGVAALATALLTGAHREPGVEVRAGAHEFPLVLLVLAALTWLRTVLGRLPVLGRLVGRRHRARAGASDLGSLPPVDRSRAVAVRILAGGAGPALAAAAGAPDVERRASRVGLVARARRGGDPFRRDHAHARAALALTGRLDEDGVDRLAGDAARTPLGVPCSEPGWIRPLDATLATLALAERGRPAAAQAWARALRGPLRLRRGHRPAWWWTPIDVGAGAMPAWEHAAVTALARSAGWVGDDDWWALRTKALGAAARGGDQAEDERLIAAARVWLVHVDDPEAARILHRPGVRRDPLACALDALAGRLQAGPALAWAACGPRPERRSVTT